MKLTVGSLVITLAVGVVLGAMGSHRLVAQQESVRWTVLLTTDLVGIAGYELRMVRAEVGPGVVGAKHPHAGTECFYVMEGVLTLDKEGEAPAHLKAGEAHCIPPGTVSASRNASTAEPYKSLLVIIAPKGPPPAGSVR
jgi:quercetin dioxygenase-like cupin family protein